MLIEQFMEIKEMAKPMKICDKCGKSMAAHHYWRNGGWHCKGVSDRAKKRAENKNAGTSSTSKKDVVRKEGESDDDFAARWFADKEAKVKAQQSKK